MNSITKSDIDIVFGKILKDFRLKNNLTQEQLSEKLDISLKYISRIENGNGGIKTQTLIKYMNILGITPNTIFNDFVDNSKIKAQIQLSEKINRLSEDKIKFLNSVIDLLGNLEK